MLLLYIDEAMIYDILGLAVSEKALFYTGSYGRIRKLINHSWFIGYVCVCVRSWLKACLDARVAGSVSSY